ncbi:hypothetical protein [Dickeya oryzae]
MIQIYLLTDQLLLMDHVPQILTGENPVFCQILTGETRMKSQILTCQELTCQILTGENCGS